MLSWAWVLPALFAAYSVNNINGMDVDALGTFRYTQDIIQAIFDGIPIAWSWQEAPRYFPDLIISTIAYLLAFGDLAKWGILFSLLNLGLLYGATLVWLWAYGSAESRRRPIACAFMLGCLLCAAMSPFFAQQWLAPAQHNGLLPLAMLFYAAPLICARLDDRAAREMGIVGFSMVFGLAIHADLIFLAWVCGPLFMTWLILALLRKGNIQIFILCGMILGLSLGIAGAANIIVEFLPFVAIHRGDNFLEQFPGSMEEVIDRFYTLRQVYMHPGSLSLLAVQVFAVLLCLATLWPSRRSDDKKGEQPIDFFMAVLFLVTVFLLPTTMMVTGKLASHYYFYIFFIAVLVIASNHTVFLERLETGPPRFRGLFIGSVAAVAVLLLFPKAIAMQSKPPAFTVLTNTLTELHSQGEIGNSGLAPYQIAYPVTLRTPFYVGAIADDARPWLWRNNAYGFWNWDSGCPALRFFSFIIIAQKSKHRIPPVALQKFFGKPSKVVKVESQEGYEIWFYPQEIGLKETLFYLSIWRSMEVKGIAMERLSGCES
ncbi:hypothetical protein [Nitrosococcus watsonii]|uniref:Uncharacterized protein n=1 Tax=Nitrosococcus watsoni (strain C-113) TaxID=105559 RepID=D8K950_NITWC|nr:hypothetical protein [Nitrosococcus watsonii]ADJ29193.1 conserved hypothetical protein [Nitrosococcus watsonii C-113]